MKHHFAYYICVSSLVLFSTLNATSFLTYLIINLTNMKISLPDHGVTLERADTSQHGENVGHLENNGFLTELELEVEDDMQDENPFITFLFKEPVKDSLYIELYQDEWGTQGRSIPSQLHLQRLSRPTF